MNPQEHQEIFPPLHDAVSAASAELGIVAVAPYPKWYSDTLSDLALLTRAEEIAFVDVAFTGDWARYYSVRIRVFTPDLVITVDAAKDAEGDSRVTSARARADLKALGVSAGMGALDRGAENHWPGQIRVKLDYGDGDPFTLPGGRGPNPSQHQRLVDLLPSLRDDLVRPGR